MADLEVTPEADSTEDEAPATPAPAVQDIDVGGGAVTTQAPPAEVTPTPVGPIQAEEQSYRDEQQANLDKAAAAQGQGDAEAAALNAGAAKLAAMLTQSQIVQSYAGRDATLAQQYANQTIDPDRYYHNQSTGGKIAAGIGMLLSGFGSGAARQSNLAEQVISNAIDRDMDAQKNAQGQAMTLWKMNREAMGNDQAAQLATQNQLMAGVKYKLNAAASQFSGPLAKASAEQANALIDRQMAQNRFKLSLMSPSSDAPDPSTRVQFLVPPERQKDVFDEIKNAQNVTQNGPKILEAFDRAAAEQRPATGGMSSVKNVIPGVNGQGVGDLHQLMLPNFSSIDGTVRQAAMDESFKNITPQAFDSDEKIAAKRQALVNWLHSESAAPVAKGFGIDLSRFPSTAMRTPPAAAPQTMGKPSATTTMNGVQYVKVPGGYQKVKGQ